MIAPHRTRLIKTVALIAVLAALVPAAAQAGGNPDALDRYLRNNAPVDPRSPDRKFPARQSQYPDAVDRAVANEYGVTPDALARYLANDVHAGKRVDYRSGDTRDAVAGRFPASAPVLVASGSGGFDWSDAGIGAGSAVALMLLLLGTREILVQRRRGSVSAAGASLLSK